MRSQSELRIISAQLDFLEERKTEVETFVLEINSVIAKCHLWMEETEENKSSLSDLLVLCAKIAENHQVDVVCDKHIAPRAYPYCTSEHVDRSTSIEEKEFQKVVSRLEVLEAAFSSLTSSNQRNENSISGVEEFVNKLSESTSTKLQQLHRKTEESGNNQSEQLQTIKSQVQSIAKDVKVLREQNKGQFEELVHDVSTCNDAVTLLQSNYSGMSHDLETVTNTCKDIDLSVISLKSSLQSLSTSCNLFQSLTELVEQERKTQIEQLQTKVQTLQEQTGSSIVLLLKHQNTLKDVLQSCVKKNEANVKKIEHLESEMNIFSTKQASSIPPTGFLASDLNYQEDFDYCVQEAKSFDITKLIEFDERNTEHIHKDFRTIFYNFECDFNPKTGIFKVKQDGLYLISAYILRFTERDISLGFVIREQNKITNFSFIETFHKAEGDKRTVNSVYLKSGQEICIYQDEVDLNTLCEFSCTLLHVV